MDDLINVVECGGRQTVSAKELHMALGVKRDFSNWIKNRIEKYGFVEGEDFSPNLVKSTEDCPETNQLDFTNSGNQDEQTVKENLNYPKSGENQVSQHGGSREENLNYHKSGKNQVSQHGGSREGAGRIGTDYLLTLGMAKELAIVENNEKGRQIRKKLIAIEQAWNTPEALIQRALQVSDFELKHWGELMGMLNDADKFIKREMPGAHGRQKAGKGLAGAVSLYKSIIQDILTVADRMVIKFDFIQRKLGVLEWYLNMTDEETTKLLFEIRAKLGTTKFYAISEMNKPKQGSRRRIGKEDTA